MDLNILCKITWILYWASTWCKKHGKLQTDRLITQQRQRIQGRFRKRKTVFRTLIKMHLQNNVIQYTLTNIMSISEKINEAQKDDVNMIKSEKWLFTQSIPLHYKLSTNHCLLLSGMAKNMVINEKEIWSISSRIYVESWIEH